MTNKGFEDFLFAVYGHKNGTANSYLKAIQIIDELFRNNDVFGLNGKSVVDIEDLDLLDSITDFIYREQLSYKKGDPSFFSHVSSKQSSYPRKGFCSAAIGKLLEYSCEFKEKEALSVIKGKRSGKRISRDLLSFFDIGKEGSDVFVTAKVRVGQNFFREMVLRNYGSKCCVTGLNVPQTLRASHIVAWADDVENRMNPENGLCLSATYDAAFDKHLISFDDDYRMILSRGIKDYFTVEVTKEYFEKFEGKQIALPALFMPSKKFLEKHRNIMYAQ